MNYSEIIILTARSRGTRGVMGCLGLYGLLAGDPGHSRLVSLRFVPAHFASLLVLLLLLLLLLLSHCPRY